MLRISVYISMSPVFKGREKLTVVGKLIIKHVSLQQMLVRTKVYRTGVSEYVQIVSTVHCTIHTVYGPTGGKPRKISALENRCSC